MAYRVDIADRAVRNLRRIYASIDAEGTERAREWFNGLEDAVFSLDQHPARGAPIPEHSGLRQVLYGRKRYRYRIIYAIDESKRIVTVIHIRHGSRAAFNADDSDDDA
jgi:plasmid stabilization system protein ParE